MENLEVYLEKLPYWGSLSPAEQESVRGAAFIRTYTPGQVIFNAAEDCLGMIQVLWGRIRAYMLSEEGREVTLYRLGRGDCCVLSASCVIRQITFETQMVAESTCQVLVVEAGTYGRLTEANMAVRCFTYELATERFSSVMWSMQQILFARIDQRLAAFLLAEYHRLDSPDIHLTHEQIAQQISSAREVVARMLKRFAADGLVEVHRGYVHLADIPGLEKLT